MTTGRPHRSRFWRESWDSRRWLSAWGANLLLALAYFGAAKFGLSLAFVNASATPVWPPTGIALAVLLLWGYRLWPGVFLGALLANIMTQGTWLTSLGIASGNALEALAGAWLVNWLANGKRAFEQPANILKFILLAACLSTMASATIGVTSLWSGGFVAPDGYAITWLTWWLGDVVSNLIFAPLLLIWLMERSTWRNIARLKLAEAKEPIILFALTAGVSYWAFWGNFPSGERSYPAHYLALLPLLWAAFRFGQRATVTLAVITSSIALGGTLRGFGPFATGIPNESLLLLQAFIGVITITTLVLASAVAQLRLATGTLQESESRLQSALSAGRMGAWEWDIRAGLVHWSPSLEQIHGLRPGLFGGKIEDLKASIHPDDAPRALERMNESVANRSPYFDTYRINHSDGAVHWVEATGELRLDAAGQPGKLVGVCVDVTERKRIEQELVESQERYRALFGLAPDLILTWNAQGVTTSVSPSLELLTGWKPADWIGKSNVHLVHPDDLPADLPESMARLVNEDPALHWEGRLLKKNGEYMDMEIWTVACRRQGNAPEFITVCHDISQRKRYEEGLRQAQRRLQTIIDSVPGLVSYVDADGKYRFNNKQYQEWFGEDPAGVQGRHLRDVLGEAAYAVIHPQVEAALAGQPVSYEAIMPYRSGGARAVNAAYLPDKDAAGQVKGYFAFVQDVTSRKSMESALQFQATALGSLHDAVIGLDTQGNIVYWNGAAAEMFGYTPEETLGQSILTVWQMAPEELRDSMAAALDGRQAIGVSARPHKDGRLVWVDIHASVLRDESGKATGFIGACRDVTTQQKAEAALLARERQQSAVAELGQFALSANNIQVVFDRAMSIVSATLEAEYCKILELLPEGAEFLLRSGVGWKEGLVGSARVPAGLDSQAGFTLATRGPVIVTEASSETRFRFPPLLVEHGVASGMSCVIWGTEGQPWGVLGAHTASKRKFTRDDAHLLQAVANVIGSAIQRHMVEQELRRADQRKNEFLALLGHELRNPLAPIRSAVDFMKLAPPQDPDTILLRDIIDRQVSHLTRLVDDLLDISRVTHGKITLRKEVVELASVMRQALEAAQPLVRERSHTLTVAAPAEGIHLEADPVRLAQVLGNLLTNAAKYTPAGGQIGLSVEEAPEQVTLRVVDNGIGIPPERLPAIFEAFVRGDQAAVVGVSGLGIGLALARNLIEMHGGALEARSAGPGQGSEFIVRLPRLVTQTPKTQPAAVGSWSGE